MKWITVSLNFFKFSVRIEKFFCSFSQYRRKHKCYCHEDYFLQSDGFSCKSKDHHQPLAIYSSRNELRQINLRTHAMRPLLSSLKNTVALDFYYSKNETLIFWTDVVDDKIYRGSLINDNSIINIEAIVEHGKC